MSRAPNQINALEEQRFSTRPIDASSNEPLPEYLRYADWCEGAPKRDHGWLPIPYFTSQDDLYSTLGALVDTVAASGGVGERLRQSETVVQLALAQPEATITAVLKTDAPSTVAFGIPQAAPTVTLSLSADLAHEIFLGRERLLSQLNAGEVEFEGPAARLLPAWPGVELAVPPRYRQMLMAAGRSDLIPQ